MQINRGGMLQRLILFPRHIDNVRMTMPNAHRHDSAERIEISASMLIPEVLHFSLHEHDRFFVVEKNSRIQELFTQTQNFVGGRAAIFLWFVVEGREFRKFHVDLVISGSEASLFASEVKVRSAR